VEAYPLRMLQLAASRISAMFAVSSQTRGATVEL
jgi:hypothetical protein